MAHYGIAVDQKRRIVRAALHGFWDAATVANYLAELGTTGAQVSCGDAPSWWLIDMRGYQVQSREVAEMMGHRLPSIFPPATTLAVVVNTMLLAVQAKRIVPNEHHRHFLTLAEAESWLTERGMPA